MLDIRRSFIMPWNTGDPNVWSALASLVIVVVSGLLAVGHRLAAGQKFSWTWFFVQMGGAVLAGYLMWDLYPVIHESLPLWCTQPIMISLAAHYGGKFFSLAERLLSRKYNLPEETNG
jgi:hypothetical protein